GRRSSLSISCLTGDTGHRVPESPKLVTKACHVWLFLTSQLGGKWLSGHSYVYRLKSGILYGNHDFAEMGGIFHSGEGLAGLPKGKYPVDYRAEAGLGNGPVHCYKMLARAHVNAAYL